MLDITFAIDLVLSKNDLPGDPLYRSIDEENIGAMGYSRGASTIAGLGAGYSPFGVKKDERIDTLMFIDGAFLHQIDFTDDDDPRFALPGLDNIDTDTLILAGSNHPNIRPGIVGISAAELANEKLTVSPRYLVTVPNSAHIAFFDVCNIQEAVAEASGLADPYLLPGGFWANPDATMSKSLYNQNEISNIFYGTKSQCRDIEYGEFIVEELNPPLNNPAEVNRITELYAVSFFKVKLSGNRRYQPYLTPGYAEANEPIVDVEVTEEEED